MNSTDGSPNSSPNRISNIRVLEVKPGDSWKTADREREYKALANRNGTPRAVLVDGAVELREGAKCLENLGENTIVLRDFKHYAANVLKALIGKDERFKEVGGKIGSTRSSTQQTELAHLTPPSLKQKARFMNLSKTLAWLSMIVWVLRNPQAKARVGIRDERMQEKLGWVAEYADEIAVWQECLREGERLPMSTEILESSFGLYKQLERQQSKSGFTSLLACLPALLKPTTPERVMKAFTRTSLEDVTAWTREHVPSTVTSRRQEAYAEYRAAFKRATPEIVAL